MNRGVVVAGLIMALALGLGGCSRAGSDSSGVSVSGSSAEGQAAVSATTVAKVQTASARAVQSGSSGFATAPIRPKAPAKTGVKLTSLQAPPDKALALISLPAKFSGAKFELVVSPYGWGLAPQNVSREKLLVRIESLKALDEGAKALKQPRAKSNAVLNLDGALADRKLIAAGGKYKVTMTVRPEGDVGAFYVEKIDALK